MVETQQGQSWGTRPALSVSESKTTARLFAYLGALVEEVFVVPEVVLLLQPMLPTVMNAATRSNAISFFTVGPSFQV
jgi:hypothetical protein